MAICPCSSGTLSAIVHGTSANLIHRAAEVHLKERRRLVLVPRETPLSIVQLDNLKRAAEAGAVILPAMPGFYHGPETIADLIDFVVSRICDQLGVENELVRRWGAGGIVSSKSRNYTTGHGEHLNLRSPRLSPARGGRRRCRPASLGQISPKDLSPGHCLPYAIPHCLATMAECRPPPPP